MFFKIHSKFLTCGADGDLRIWNGIDDDDPLTQCVGEFTISCAQYDERIIVTTDVNTVQAYTYPDCDRDGTNFRCTGIVNCVKAGKEHLAIGTEDMIIQVLRKDLAEDIFELIGHSGPILSIDVSPKNHLASSSGDGSIKVWNLETKKNIETFTGLETTKSFNNARTYCKEVINVYFLIFYFNTLLHSLKATPTFEPKTGKYLAYPKSREIIVMDTLDWSTSFVLADKNVNITLNYLFIIKSSYNFTIVKYFSW